MNREFVVDALDVHQWKRACEGFEMHNLYQTWDYAAFHSPDSPARATVRCQVLRAGLPAAIGQFRVKTIPLVGWGVAELEWGPLWRPEDGDEGLADCRFFFDEVRKEMVEKRKLEVRIFPHTTHPHTMDEQLGETLRDRGFLPQTTETRNYDTVMIDLSKNLETLRSELHPKWRNLLKKAEKSDLVVEFGRDVALFDRFVGVYDAMRRVKEFPTGVRIPIIRAMQRSLPPSERFLVAVATSQGRDAAAAVWAATGSRLLYFLGATDPEHRESSPGHLLQWEVLRVGKESGLRWYDLGGLVDEGVTRFKVRMGGELVAFPRRFVARPGWVRSKSFELAEKGIEWIRR